jgi:NAD(P)H dehydrogenase (quinone)
MLERISLIYHSANGFTNRVAKHIFDGLAAPTNRNARLLNVEFLSKDDWSYLRSSDAIILGAPTYFGGVSGQFKRFMDQTIDIWSSGDWKGKIAGGFVTAADARFDAFCSLNQMFVFAAQHGMQWANPLAFIPAEHHPKESSRVVVSYGIVVCGSREKVEIVLSKQEVALLKEFGLGFANAGCSGNLGQNFGSMGRTFP